jgi:hypothetical protein
VLKRKQGQSSCRRLHAVALLLVCLAGPLSAASGATPADEEYEQKGNFLAMVPSFVEWPGETSAADSKGQPFQICVYGRYSFGSQLVERTRGIKVRGASVVVRWVRKLPELNSCQVVFVSESESKQYAKVLSALQDAPALTVGETADFLAAGGMVYLEKNAQGLTIDVNLEAAKKAKLKISSRLLALARSVLSLEGKTGD